MSLDDSDLTALLSSAALVFVGQLCWSLSKLLERVLVANVLSPDAYGEVSIGLAVLTTASTIAILGCNQGVPRYISRFDDERDVRGAWVSGLLLTGGLSLVVAVALLVGRTHVTALLFDRAESVTLVVLFVLAFPFVVGMQIGVGAIRGFENTIYRTYARDLTYPLVRLGALAVLLSAGVGVLAAGYAYLLAAVVAFAVTHLFLARLLPLFGPVSLHTRELFQFSAPLMLSAVLSMLLTRADTLMLGAMTSSYQVGLYSSAYPLASAMLLILSSFGFLYLPLASRLDADGRRDEIDQIYALTTKWIYVLTLPVFVTIVVFSRDVIVATFGIEYAEAGAALSILVVGFFTSAMFGRNRETLSALGDTTILLVTNGFALVSNLGLNLVLIPRYGYRGAAVASAASFVALNLAVFVVLKTRYDITPLSRASTRTFLLLPPPLFALALTVDRFVSLDVITLPLFAVALGILGLVIAGVAGCFQPEDRVPLEAIEERVGITVPFARRYIPSRPDEQRA